MVKEQTSGDRPCCSADTTLPSLPTWLDSLDAAGAVETTTSFLLLSADLGAKATGGDGGTSLVVLGGSAPLSAASSSLLWIHPSQGGGTGELPLLAREAGPRRAAHSSIWLSHSFALGPRSGGEPGFSTPLWGREVAPELAECVSSCPCSRVDLGGTTVSVDLGRARLDRMGVRGWRSVRRNEVGWVSVGVWVCVAGMGSGEGGGGGGRSEPPGGCDWRCDCGCLACAKRVGDI